MKKDVHLLGYEREIEYKTKYTSGKASYVEQNQALIDMSDFCIFYFDKNYLPQKNKTSGSTKSGTALAYKYAKLKKKHIINVFM